jgi:hypothetical protein
VEGTAATEGARRGEDHRRWSSTARGEEADAADMAGEGRRGGGGGWVSAAGARQGRGGRPRRRLNFTSPVSMSSLMPFTNVNLLVSEFD